MYWTYGQSIVITVSYDRHNNNNMESESNNAIVNGHQEQDIQNIKHPLERKWSYWMYTDKSSVWEKNLVKLTTFDTVEDFWCLYHHMKLPTELKVGQDYMVFKDGITPMWENEANKKGGRWIIGFEKKTFKEMDRIWLGVILLMIGENFMHPDLVCGALVNVRAKSKICLWTRSVDEKQNCEVARKIKNRLGLYSRLHFYMHESKTSLYSV
ncbi:eukaryotic translation initiation factor 4E-like isoform X1 [Manduca sexta]|uniref:eukaryotic translation initiation factor 4E-like isoform X1 n=2 Tax=Manduca sexta TaxID=7130 RepID=UPI00188F8053|nr:eukaryotic translation initiation factor 4E-like isoform X1 [Manduca sexta]